MTIAQELSEATKVSRKTNEEEQAFLVRLHEKANALTDEEWRSLSNEAQDWVNSAGKAREKGKKVPALATTNGSAPAEEAEEAEETKEEAPAKKAKTTKAKTTKAKKAAPAKKAKTKTTKAEPKAKTKTAKAKSTATGKRGRKGKFPLDGTIKLLQEGNPHRTGTKSHKMFSKYKQGMSVEQALAAGIKWKDLSLSSQFGFIKIS